MTFIEFVEIIKGNLNIPNDVVVKIAEEVLEELFLFHNSTISEIREDTLEKFIVPEIGSIWLNHGDKDKSTYTVTHIANLESKNNSFPITVIYQGDNLKILAKYLIDFNRTMEKKS